VSKVIRYNYPNIYQKAREWGFRDPHLPRELGGFGLPPRTSKENLCKSISSTTQGALYYNIYSTNSKFFPGRDPKNIWSLTSQGTSRMLGSEIVDSGWEEDVLKDKEKIIYRRGKVPPPGTIP